MKPKRVRCKVTGVTGKLRYHYKNDEGERIAVILPDNDEDLMNGRDEIKLKDLEIL